MRMEDYVAQVVNKIAECAKLNVLSSLVDCERIAKENQIDEEFVYEVFQGEFNREFSRRIK